jgi:hypothetical protein
VNRLFLSAMILTAWTAPALAATEGDGDGDASVLFEDTYLDSGYTALSVESAKIGKEPATFVGAAGGWRLSPALTLGLQANVLASAVKTEDDNPGKLSCILLGGFGEYEVWRHGLFSALAGASVNWGQLSKRADDPAEGADEYEADSFLAAGPQIAALVRLSYRLDLGVSVAARASRGVEVAGVEESALQGAVVGAFIRGNF